MDNTPDYTSDLPDNFDPAWEEPMNWWEEQVYEQDWEDWRDECYEDDMYHDAAIWESAYGPADDGGWAF